MESIRLHWADTVPERRRPHVLGCAQAAVRLAVLHGVDPLAAEAAALLHDCTKALDTQQQLILCEQYGIILESDDLVCPNIIHAYTGAHVARQRFGVNDELFCAIYTHAIGSANMTTLGKIIFVADKTEETRSFDGVDKIRRIAEQSLDLAVYEFTAENIAYLAQRRMGIHPATLETYNLFISGRSENGQQQ